ncbi:rRNA methylase [Streptococcus equi subsp. equi]|uniref:class I SAM-dependent methyltransferase n=1 Tax=Streptococcus equi TaxID=1336 RepID=UPI000658C35B|nr:class I SAM-dependent methyltransferase [Streptococcus equi]WGS34940.1 class I SAM-dependent methyltransferase [Streptococcus equi]CRR03485.1 rRNA methylase [Streptococcus equi subsp. equi]CRR05396.1 rRNA methylase [Streptococcus equi subsp. equi]CRR06127.1 rRNA methylase [Streptococcus equi subsp. equi]CRT01153.1 rRNA methylase [Streptococcus equi subsp. equi]
MIKRPIHVSHEFLKEVLDKQSIAVDATMGNGYDTAFLASLSQRVYAFDVQQQALTKTQERLEQQGLTNAELILAGHEQVDQYVKEPIRAAIFNLGYLPNADKSLITRPETTILALAKILDRLELSGRIAIMVYYGHDGGSREKEELLDYIGQLNQRQVTAMLYQPINQMNQPPFLIMLEKIAATD